MIYPALLNQLLEPALNQVLALDPDLEQFLKPLSGKVIAIAFKSDQPLIYICPADTRIQLLDHYDGKVDTTLTGSPAAFIKIALSKTPATVLSSGEIIMTGDTHTGRQFQALFEQLDLDWEGLLARASGDVVAHKLGQLLKGGQSWLNESLQTFQLNTAEFLQEESRTVPAPPEVDHHYQAINRLRDDSERLAARIDRLQSTLTSDSQKTPS